MGLFVAVAAGASSEPIASPSKTVPSASTHNAGGRMPPVVLAPGRAGAWRPAGSCRGQTQRAFGQLLLRQLVFGQLLFGHRCSLAIDDDRLAFEDACDAPAADGHASKRRVPAPRSQPIRLDVPLGGGVEHDEVRRSAGLDRPAVATARCPVQAGDPGGAGRSNAPNSSRSGHRAGPFVRRVWEMGREVSRPIMPKGAKSNGFSFMSAACGA